MHTVYKIKGAWDGFGLPEDGDDAVQEPTDGIVTDTLIEKAVTTENAPFGGRVPSTNAEPHRVLKYVPHDPMRGEDVRALQVAGKKRLSARNIDRPMKADGVFGKQTAEALDTAQWALGTLQETVKSPELSIGAQRIIRYPGSRTAVQLQRARDRMTQLEKDRNKPTPKPGPGGGPSGLTAAERTEARNIALDAFKLMWQHSPVVHYTQTSLRWQGIHNGLKAFRGQYPTYADCSSAYTWCLWNAFDHFNHPDTVNGLGWGGGYTGTLLSHGDHVALNALLPGDAILYGTGWPGHHVAMYIGGGLVYSHGSEAGPFRISMYYRRDIMGARRYI